MMNLLRFKLKSGKQRSHPDTTDAALIGDVYEALIADARAGMTPRDMVSYRLLHLLPKTVGTGSEVRTRDRFGNGH